MSPEDSGRLCLLGSALASPAGVSRAGGLLSSRVLTRCAPCKARPAGPRVQSMPADCQPCCLPPVRSRPGAARAPPASVPASRPGRPGCMWPAAALILHPRVSRVAKTGVVWPCPSPLRPLHSAPCCMSSPRGPARAEGV